MSLYPIFLNIEKTPCLVVGGGEVAERKVLSLLEAKAKVTVVSPELTDALKKLVKTKKIRHIKRVYKAGDIKGFSLVISAASSLKANKEAGKEAKKLRIPLNVVDNPTLCTFIVPAIVKRGELMIAISTSGKSPYFAKTLRLFLDEVIPREFGVLVNIIGAVRNKLLKQSLKNDKKVGIYAKFMNPVFFALLRKKDRQGIDRFLKGLLGRGYGLSSLGIRI
ncbi:MAG: bifunctional precorrin-2 dehydrogenase/sirohydrochlorin ferrochelatase [Thermodesulfobacteriota bacterium]